MMTADSLHLGMSSDMSFRCAAPCRRACRASAFASHVAQPSARSSPVQTACPERAMPVAWLALAGGHAAYGPAPPVRRRTLPRGRAKAQGKIKGRGTSAREKSVCTWGWRGTRQRAAACREGAQRRTGVGEVTCFARRSAMVLDGCAP